MRETVAVVALLLLAPGGAALAQSNDELAVRGSVTGSLGRGRQVRFDVTATHPDGWASIATVGASLELRGAALETLEYEPTDSQLSSGESSVLAGTGDDLDGRFFEVAGTGITVTTGGTRMTLRFRARMLAQVPTGARFRFTAVDQQGQEVSTSLRAAVEQDEGGGLSLGTVILAVIAALVAGGFFGGQLASSRKPKSSVYSTVARRITDERSHAGDRP